MMNLNDAKRFETARRATHRAGFTLIELLITLAVLAAVMMVVMSVVFMTSRSKTATANAVEANQAVRVAVEMLGRDLRSAGYGADRDYPGDPQPPIAYIDSMQVLLYADFSGNAGVRDTSAYDPADAPRPFPLDGTAWRPNVKYRTGAELIRWTLDVNNDGVVDAADVADSNGVDARRTPNPNDYMLVRQTYGDSTTALAEGNGGSIERVALVRRPTEAGVPPMFTVWLKEQDQPWDWSNGPLPANRLDDVERITIEVVGTSGRPDWLGHFSETRIETQINSMRNVPKFGADEYVVDGWVYEDQNLSGTREISEPVLAGANVRVGPYSTMTDSTGYYVIQVPAGTYLLKHVPPVGYASAMSPDSFTITVPPSVSQSFADSARAGGQVRVRVFYDTDMNGAWDTGEDPYPNVYVTMQETGETKSSNGSGEVQLFAPVGAYTALATMPDSLSCTTANPMTGSMTNGGTAVHELGVVKGDPAVVSGTVFKDNDRDGVHDSGEPGLQNVWVGVSPDGGSTVKGFAYTDASGDYEIEVPPNDPPGTEPYWILAIAPTQHFPTTAAAIGPLLLRDTDNLNNQDFGFALYRVITLNASRVLSLASANLIEQQNDWTGGAAQWNTKGREDVDIVLGADAGGLDNISVWYNQYDDPIIFNTDADYRYNAANSVLSLAVAGFDSETPVQRPDVVTGTQRSASGNLFVWKNQNSSGNLGILPASPLRSYTTADAGDVTSVLAFDCAGGSYPDLIVGTRSPFAGRGTFEIWQNNEGVTPTFSQVEIYPTAGGLPAGSLGEITGMALADFDVPADGRKDLVVVTKLTEVSGQLLFFRNLSNVTGARFIYTAGAYLGGGAPTSVTVNNVNKDFDTATDVVMGIQTSTATGVLQVWRNQSMGGAFSFAMVRQVSTPGIPLTLCTADLGGAVDHLDLAVGLRQSTSSYAGGVRIYYTDSNTLPATGVDPSTGDLVNMVPALTANNFNYGVRPSTPPTPYLTDLAVGVKIDLTTGALVVFVR